MKNLNRKVPVIIFAGIFLLTSIILFPIHGIAKAKYYAKTDELLCGDVKVRAITTCTEDSVRPYPKKCTDQHFIFINKMTDKIVNVKGSSEYYNANFDEVDEYGKKINKWIGAWAYSWACVQGRKEPYIIIMYSGGGSGNCDGCEWAEIYNLNGKLLISDKGKPREKKIKEFKKVYKKLGLPIKWPHSSFSYIKQLKKEN